MVVDKSGYDGLAIQVYLDSIVVRQIANIVTVADCKNSFTANRDCLRNRKIFVYSENLAIVPGTIRCPGIE